MNEEWREVPGFPGYRASSLGRVMNGRGKVLNCRDRDGYQRSRISVGGKSRFISHHSLVAAAFIGPRPADSEIDHIDGVRDNNAPENLRYCSHAENMERLRKPGCYADRRRNGLTQRPPKEPKPKVFRSRARPPEQHKVRRPVHLVGAQNGRAKLTEAMAREILALPRPDKRTRERHPNSIQAIAERYGISKASVSELCSGKTWAHLHTRLGSAEQATEQPNTKTSAGSEGGEQP